METPLMVKGGTQESQGGTLESFWTLNIISRSAEMADRDICVGAKHLQAHWAASALNRLAQKA
jgi:hypothetical protein